MSTIACLPLEGKVGPQGSDEVSKKPTSEASSVRRLREVDRLPYSCHSEEQRDEESRCASEILRSAQDDNSCGFVSADRHITRRGGDPPPACYNTPKTSME